MKAENLMIGNIVYLQDGDPTKNQEYHIKADDIIKHDTGYFAQNGYIVTPILLTEEWLLKFGFSDKDYKTGYIGKDFKYGEWERYNFVLTKPHMVVENLDKYIFELKEHRIKPISYVHELQNFYLAITEQKLTLK